MSEWHSVWPTKFGLYQLVRSGLSSVSLLLFPRCWFEACYPTTTTAATATTTTSGLWLQVKQKFYFQQKFVKSHVFFFNFSYDYTYFYDEYDDPNRFLVNSTPSPSSPGNAGVGGREKGLGFQVSTYIYIIFFPWN